MHSWAHRCTWCFNVLGCAEIALRAVHAALICVCPAEVTCRTACLGSLPIVVGKLPPLPLARLADHDQITCGAQVLGSQRSTSSAIRVSLC